MPLANRASTTVFDFKRGELFFFARGRPEFFFTERASPRAFLFFCGGGELKFFSGKTIPKSTKLFSRTGGAAGADLELGHVGWLFRCRRCAAASSCGRAVTSTMLPNGAFSYTTSLTPAVPALAAALFAAGGLRSEVPHRSRCAESVRVKTGLFCSISEMFWGFVFIFCNKAT